MALDGSNRRSVSIRYGHQNRENWNAGPVPFEASAASGQAMAGRFENEHRRHEKATAESEHAGNEADSRSHAYDHGPIDRDLRDGKINFHGSGIKN